MAMKTIPQSLNIRSLILENFEQAVLTTDVAEQNSLINFVLVGGGPTGVELAGALAEMKSHSAKDYPDLDIANANKFDSKWRQNSEYHEREILSSCRRISNQFGCENLENVRVTNYDGARLPQIPI
jgi:NADH dehydrogenase